MIPGASIAFLDQEVTLNIAEQKTQKPGSRYLHEFAWQSKTAYSLFIQNTFT